MNEPQQNNGVPDELPVLPPPPPKPNIPNGYIRNPLVIGSCVAAIETYILALLFRLTQMNATIIIRRFTEDHEWADVHYDVTQFMADEIQTMFAAVVCAYEAGLNNAAIMNREAFYQVRQLGYTLRARCLDRLAASIGVSRWQLGIFPESRGNARWTSSLISILYVDGTVQHGSDYVSMEIPPMYLVRAIRIDPRLRLVQIMEGGWALARLTFEKYFVRLAAEFPTVGISTGGLASDNVKIFIKYLTDRLPLGGRAVILVDGDAFGLKIVASILFGSLRHLMDFRALNLEYCSILQGQWELVRGNSKRSEPAAMAEAHRIQEELNLVPPEHLQGNVARMQTDLERMIQSKRQISMAALAGDGFLSANIWTAVREQISVPRTQSWPGHTPYILQPLFTLEDVANAQGILPETELVIRPNGKRILRVLNGDELVFVIVKPLEDEPVVQVNVTDEYLQDGDTQVGAQVFLEELYDAHIDEALVGKVQDIYDAMCRIAGGSRDENVLDMYERITECLTALEEGMRPFRLQRFPDYPVAETLVLLEKLYHTPIPVITPGIAGGNPV